MIDLLARRSFTAEYANSWRPALQDPSATELPPLQRVFHGRRGITRLILSNCAPFNDEAGATIGFDIEYAHSANDEPRASRSLTEIVEGLPPNLRFIDSGRFAASLSTEQPTISVSPLKLAKRRNLLILGHELGYFAKAQLIDNAIKLALEQTTDKDTEASLEPYSPAISALADYSRTHPQFAEDYANIEKAWQADPTTLIPSLYHAPGARLPLIAQHEEAEEIVNAVAEASAWMEAFALVEEDTIHPGMSTKAMHKMAYWALQSYDEVSDLKMHVPTLEYALAGTL